MAKEKLDIFSILRYLDEGHMEVYQVISEDDEMLKEFKKNLPWVIKQWHTGAVQNHQHRGLIRRFDDFCNIGWFNFPPELQTKLLACCGSGKAVKHKFYKVKSRSIPSNLVKLLKRQYYDIREEEVKLWISKTDDVEFQEYLNTLGIQEEEQKLLKKDFKEYKHV